MQRYGQRLMYSLQKNETQGNYQGKLILEHIQIKLVESNEPLVECGPPPDWLRKNVVFKLKTPEMIIFVNHKRHADSDANHVFKETVRRSQT